MRTDLAPEAYEPVRTGAAGPHAEETWRLPHLDVLRGLAATWVVLFHTVFLTTPNMVPPGLIETFVKNGGMGVTLFFVVSAFSLCLSSDRHHNEARWIFYIRRLFRIVPLFYAMMAVTLLRDQMAFNLSHSYSEIVANALFLFNFVPEWQTGIVWASWTIGVEMVFYFLFPYIWGKCDGMADAVYRVMLFLMLSVVAYAIVSYFEEGAKFWQWSFFKYLPSFLLGVLAYATWKATRDQRRSLDPTALGRMFLATSIFLGAALLYSGQEFQLISGLYWQAVIFSLLAIGAALGAARGFFSIPALRWVGKNSYSIYLVHPLIIVALQPLYSVVATKTGSGPLTFLICSFITLCCVFIISEICWHLIEKPSIDAGSRLIRHLRTLSPQPRHAFNSEKI